MNSIVQRGGRATRLLAFLLFTLALAVAFVDDPLGIDASGRFETLTTPPRPVWPEEIRPERGLTYSDDDIVVSLEHYRDQPAFTDPGVMLKAAEDDLYFSQFALQRLLYSLFVPAEGDIGPYIEAFRIANAVLLAAVLGLFCLVVATEFGLVSAMVVLLLMAVSDWLLAFSVALFYGMALRFLPFILTWHLLQRRPGHEPGLGTYGAIGGTVLLASLCGYDYITNVIVATALPVLYYGLRNGWPRRATLIRGSACVLAGLAGMGVAIVLHVIALVAHLGSIDAAIAAIGERAELRLGLSEEGLDTDNYEAFALAVLERIPLVGGPLAAAASGIAPVLGAGVRWVRFLMMDAVTLPLGRQLDLAMPIGGFVVLVLGALGYRLQARGWLGLRASPGGCLLLVALAGFVVSNLWAIAFPQHMLHVHLNAIMFYLPFLLLAYAVIGQLIQNALVGAAPARPAPPSRA